MPSLQQIKSEWVGRMVRARHVYGRVSHDWLIEQAGMMIRQCRAELSIPASPDNIREYVSEVFGEETHDAYIAMERARCERFAAARMTKKGGDLSGSFAEAMAAWMPRDE